VIVEALLAVISVPLLLLNLLSGIVAGIWLILLGDWRIVVGGFIYAFAGVFLISLAIAPGLIFAAPAAMAAQKGRSVLALVLGLPSLLWTYLPLFGSCFLFMKYAAQTHDGSILPYLLWAYSTALAPWSYMAQKEQQAGNEYSLYAVSGAQVAMLSMGIALLIDESDYSFARLGVWMVPGVLFTFVLQGMQIWVNTRQRRMMY
jgi:hypothetical protein